MCLWTFVFFYPTCSHNAFACCWQQSCCDIKIRKYCDGTIDLIILLTLSLYYEVCEWNTQTKNFFLKILSNTGLLHSRRSTTELQHVETSTQIQSKQISSRLTCGRRLSENLGLRILALKVKFSPLVLHSWGNLWSSVPDQWLLQISRQTYNHCLLF